MIIQCPNCGFSGRIPRYAITVPHLARCLRCRHQFEPSSPLTDDPREDLAAPSSGAVFGGQGGGHGGDPGSSSYELKAIAEDPAIGIEVAGGAVPWDDEDDEAILNGDGLLLPKGAARPPVASGITPLPHLRLASRLKHGPKDPWYSRVLQAWGIFFLLWGATILGRSAYHLVTADHFASAGRDIFWSVVSALLLVPGAAGMFLLVDLGRYIRNLSDQPQYSSELAEEPSGESASPPLRTWPTETRTLPAVRAATGR